MSDININKVVLKKEGNRYIFDPKGNIDLSNYYTKEETDSKYALTSHTHSIANITNLQSTLDGKSNTNHTHSNYATTSDLNSVRNTANSALNTAQSNTFAGTPNTMETDLVNKGSTIRFAAEYNGFITIPLVNMAINGISAERMNILHGGYRGNYYSDEINYFIIKKGQIITKSNNSGSLSVGYITLT